MIRDSEISKIYENVIEEKPTKINGIGSYRSPFFDERKLQVAPTTLIIVAHKK